MIIKVYFDNNASTPVAPEVMDAMLPYFTESWGNPASLHSFGIQVRNAIDQARTQVANLVGAHPSDVIFTGGGTESNNLAIFGAWQANTTSGPLVTSRVEHPAVAQPIQALKKAGAEVIAIGVNPDGTLDTAGLTAALAKRPALVSLMWANNETGVCFPTAKLAEQIKASGALLHTDAVQAVGRQPVNLADTPIDLLSLSGHKLHGPKGVGALIVRKGTRLKSQLLGGGHENGLRAGTLNVPGIVGLGKACECAAATLVESMTTVAALRDELEAGLLAAFPGATANGATTERIPGTSNISFPGLEGESLLYHLDDAGISTSTGAACTSGRMEPSHVLLAMGLNPARAGASVRFSLSRYNTAAEVAYTIEQARAIADRR
ncbi:MAG: aminotransferase class V-fold PLP-dependent enzyme [Verrucomicrobia bacterium]|nr:aminotransferase class V-fold PLP-dependent enzyme [Verrucomicrobiota bacterium]